MPTPLARCLIGFFINTVAVRADLSGAPSFSDVLHQVRSTVLEGYAHQDIPFEDVVAGVSAARTVGHNPLFQTWFNLLGESDRPPRLPGLNTSIVELPAHASLFDLGLYVTDHGDRLRLDLAYDGNLFTDARAEAILDQMTLVLAGAVLHPDRPVADISLVGTPSRKLLPNPGAELSPARTAALAAGIRAGMSTSLVHDSSTTLDAERLLTLSAQVNHHLAHHGVGSGDIVAVYAARCAVLVPLLLGIHERGAAFLLLDPAHPPTRLAAQTAAAGAAHLVHFPAAGPLPRELQESEVPISDMNTLLATTSEPLPALPPAPSGPAYVMFTSGSTSAVPRGVVGTSAPLAHFLSWYTNAFQLTADSRFALLSGLGHDPLLRDILTPLWTGGQLHVPDDDLLHNPVSLLRWLAHRRITVLHLTPPLARLLALAAAEAGVRLPEVRLVCYGGDVLRSQDVSSLAAIAPYARHVNFYGATETPQAMTYHVVSPQEVMGDETAAVEGAGASVPIGTGIDGVQALIINAAGNLAGIGEVGEIVVRTAFLTEGYLQPSSAGGFHRDPQLGVRRYATGDSGRYLPDGTVEVLGRIDSQVKIRGFRVDPSEIDAAFLRIPGVCAATTLARFSPLGDTRLVTYIVTATPHPSAEDVRTSLEALLPAHMVPSEVLEISSMPLTPNGKINTAELLNKRATPPLSGGGTAPDDTVEETLRAIWQEAIGTDEVALNDNFFDLGGTSQLMVRVQALLHERTGQDVPLVSLFRYASVRSLARHLRGATTEDSAAPSHRRGRSRDGAAAHAQRLGRRNATP
ncbi:AMP-binding protein [Streptomyces kanamyceticus]|uniref:Carrier domain-containing protein n=1 Tax=Streptomyces kanamyceticus TaxID=1967 RepID=A0A5J6GLY5_STRKN|nr:AMP-binding protein [Streptomyces kanamyceticus]QEU96930.1 hypothetical protein CP970_43715 [Streptomyces kanamyceticus]